MPRLALLPLLLLLAGAALAEPAPLDPASPPPAWRDRLDALVAPASLAAPFVETRETPVRKRPVVLDGVVRLARGHGLSLDYTRERAPLVIMDEQGLLLRHADGRKQAPPPEAAASVGLLHALFAFDLGTLARDYAITAEELADDAWTLVFTRRPESSAYYRELSLHGEGARLARIRLVRVERHVTTIQIGPPAPDVVFTPEDLARWFR